MLLADALHQRSALLKLAERRRMKPYIPGIRIHLLLQYLESLTLATPHLAHLLIEKAGNGNAPKHEINDDIINHDCLLIGLLSITMSFLA